MTSDFLSSASTCVQSSGEKKMGGRRERRVDINMGENTLKFHVFLKLSKPKEQIRSGKLGSDVIKFKKSVVICMRELSSHELLTLSEEAATLLGISCTM